MTKLWRFGVVLGLFLAAAIGLGEVVVLRGGAVIQLKQPPVRQGKSVLLTRTDGTLLSVPATEIDVAATAAARSVQPAPVPAALPAATLAEAARASRQGPKARVKITDADVSHNEAAQASGALDAGSAEAPKEAGDAGAGRVEVGEYSQEKSGEALVVRGTLRNPGSTPAINVRMSVTALDARGQTITSSEAGVSGGAIEPTKEVAFTVTLPVGARAVGSLRFSPRWISPEPARPAAAPDAAARDRAAAPDAQAAPAAAPRASAPPPPAPTPYGRGSLYAPAAPNAPSQAPSDGKTGYIPGASHPDNQPKPPN